jgi:hypothetical protein
MKPKLNHEAKSVLLVVLVMLLSACGLARLNGGTKPSSERADNSSSKITTPFSPSNDASKDVREAIAKLNTAYPYRLTETVSASANSQAAMPEGTRVAEFAAADRVHMKSTSKIGGDVEAITIGDRHYWYSGGKWTEGKFDLASNGGPEFAKKVTEMFKDVKYVGAETVNGIDCHVYSCIIDGSMGGQNWKGTIKFWIGASDGLPHQSDSDFKVANSFGGRSHIVYEYGVNIKVEPPPL